MNAGTPSVPSTVGDPWKRLCFACTALLVALGILWVFLELFKIFFDSGGLGFINQVWMITTQSEDSGIYEADNESDSEDVKSGDSGYCIV